MSDQQNLPKQRKDNPLIELSVVIPLFTVAIIGCIYYKELGYFTRRDIPREFIQIEVNRAFEFVFALLHFLWAHYSAASSNLWSVPPLGHLHSATYTF